MSSFTDAQWVPTDLRDAHGHTLYRITPGFSFYIGYPGSGLSVEIDDGTLTDGPSWPTWIRRLAKRLGLGGAVERLVRSMLKSSAVHDKLRKDRRFAKLETDAIFLVAENAEGTPGWLKWLGFLGVLLNNSRD